jgi:hypothetical protein
MCGTLRPDASAAKITSIARPCHGFARGGAARFSRNRTFKSCKWTETRTGHPGRIFGIVTPFYLFEVNHARFSRFDGEPILGNWDVFLNVLNVETEDGATGAKLRQVLFGEPNPGDRFDQVLSSLYIQVLRPLCWTGLLEENRAKGLLRTWESMFTKTPLWRTALRLETDSMVRLATRH